MAAELSEDAASGTRPPSRTENAHFTFRGIRELPQELQLWTGDRDEEAKRERNNQP
jgi:hypothetical protein